MYRRQARPIYGVARNKHDTITNSCICPTDLMTMLGNLQTVIDAFFPSFEGTAPLMADMKATAFLGPGLYVRILWSYRNKNRTFPRVTDPDYADAVLDIKDIYAECGITNPDDFLFKSRSIEPVNMTKEEIDEKFKTYGKI